MTPQETLEFVSGDLNCTTAEQKRVRTILYRKALVTRDFGTGEYRLNERGEKFRQWLEANK